MVLRQYNILLAAAAQRVYRLLWELRMKWADNEIEMLSPILEQVRKDVGTEGNKNVLVLCSAGGDVALWLAKTLKPGKITGLELDQQLLESARQRACEQGLSDVVDFRRAERRRIPFPEHTFDALVSEFIVYPTSTPTEIGQAEMARVIKSGGVMILTDVIATKPIPQEVRAEFQAIGLDYLCEGTPDDFYRWMKEAHLTDIEVWDVTPVVRRVWQQRRTSVSTARRGFTYLLDEPRYKLGEAIFYIYVRAKKP